MKNKFLYCVLGMLLLCASASAQVVSKDSLAALNNQKKVLALNKKLNDNKIELAELENKLPKAAQDAETTAGQAKKSVEENRLAAEKLGSDPQDKALSKKASKAASAASRDAKRARKASDSLEKLKRTINSVRSKIKDDEAKLAELTAK